MHAWRIVALFWILLALGTGVVACGSGSSQVAEPADEEPDDSADDPADDPGEDPVVPGPDGATLWADLGCGGCHAADGSGAYGPDVTCYPPDGLSAYLVPASTPHVAGAQEAMTAEDALALSEFLAAGGCTDSVPASHTVSMGDAVFHHPDYANSETACTPCHGPSLEGYGTVPSCASCHDGGAAGSCTSCHQSAQDNDDGTPTDGRRAVMGEFSLASHHGPSDPTDDDCRVCHEMTEHKQGAVRLFDVDDTSTVIVLTDDPASDADEAAKLDAFCLACHDADAADGSNPFSDDKTPPAIDATAWAASAHAGNDLTCAGDGSSIGCHTVRHGSSYAALLYDDYVVADPNERSDGDYDACWACHSKQTILFSDDAFDEYHKKHIVDEDTACAVCHNPHGSYDSSERGLIDFERALDEGWMSLTGTRTLSSSFTTNSSGGTCALRCHGEAHGAGSAAYTSK